MLTNDIRYLNIWTIKLNFLERSPRGVVYAFSNVFRSSNHIIRVVAKPCNKDSQL